MAHQSLSALRRPIPHHRWWLARAGGWARGKPCPLPYCLARGPPPPPFIRRGCHADVWVNNKYSVIAFFFIFSILTLYHFHFLISVGFTVVVVAGVVGGGQASFTPHVRTMPEPWRGPASCRPHIYYNILSRAYVHRRMFLEANSTGIMASVYLRVNYISLENVGNGHNFGGRWRRRSAASPRGFKFGMPTGMGGNRSSIFAIAAKKG